MTPESRVAVARSAQPGAVGRDEPRRSEKEPRGITLADLMVVVAGLAIGFVVQPVRLETTRVHQACGFHANVVTYESVYWTAARFALPVVLAVGVAVLARRVRFGGSPRPAEWLALVVLLLLLDPVIPKSEPVMGPFVTRDHDYVNVHGAWVPTKYVRSAVLVSIDAGRSLGQIALGTVSVAGLIGAVVWLAAHRRLSERTRTFLLLALGWAWLRVPLRLNPEQIVNFRYSWLTIPVPPPPAGWSREGFAWYLEARLALGHWFLGVWVAAVAATAALSLIRRTPGVTRWTEWAGAALALVLGLAWAWDELVLRPAPGTLVRATVFAVWFLAVAVPGWWWAHRFGPTGGTGGSLQPAPGAGPIPEPLTTQTHQQY